MSYLFLLLNEMKCLSCAGKANYTDKNELDNLLKIPQLLSRLGLCFLRACHSGAVDAN